MIWLFYKKFYSYFDLHLELSSELIFSKKNSKTYFFINSSFIEYAIDLIFFSNIAKEEGSFFA